MTREVVQIIDKETGDVNNLRDKKLADSTTQQQSGSASTDSVVMKTTGGDYVEIARDSFVGAIKSVMDGLIKGNSYTTLGANDPIAAFNSNALGGITPANLASVLGALDSVCSVVQTTNNYVADCMMTTRKIVCGRTSTLTGNMPSGGGWPVVVIIPIWFFTNTETYGYLRFYWKTGNNTDLWVRCQAEGDTGWKKIAFATT